MELPIKSFEVPFKKDPRPDIYKELTDCNSEYPITKLSESPTYLPDFTRAVALGNSVWRVNVPGYFFKCPGTTNKMASSAKSGIIIDRYNHRLNAVGNHSHRHSKIKNTDEAGNVSGVDYYNPKHHDEYVEKKLVLSIDYIKDNDYTGRYAGDIANTSYTYRPKAWDAFMPSVTVGTTLCHVAILANQREYPEYMPSGNLLVRDYGCDYVVSSGVNSSGGISNSMIPIIPGVATTSKPTNITYETGWSSEQPTLQAWSINALSETTLATITRTIKITNYWCQDDLNKAKNVIDVTGLIEAKGTYVYAYKDSACTDTYYFVPAKSVDQTINPVTKIRTITNSYSCTPNLPSADVAFGAFPTSSTLAHRQDKAEGCAYGRQISGVGFSATLKTKTKSYTVNQAPNVNCNPVMHVHATAMDTYFTDIFANPSISGHKTPFVAQDLTLQIWPGVCTESVSDINGHATHKVFNPVVASS